VRDEIIEVLYRSCMMTTEGRELVADEIEKLYENHIKIGTVGNKERKLTGCEKGIHSIDMQGTCFNCGVNIYQNYSEETK